MIPFLDFQINKLFFFLGLFPILLPRLLAVATFRRLDVASHTSDAELEDKSGDRIKPEFRDKQLSPYVDHDDDLKNDARRA